MHPQPLGRPGRRRRAAGHGPRARRARVRRGSATPAARRRRPGCTSRGSPADALLDGAARRSSAPSTCDRRPRPASGTPAASRRRTCCAPGRATPTDAPDVVVRPGDHDEVRGAGRPARRAPRRASCPFGGGTSVVGGLRRRGARGSPASSRSTCAGSTALVAVDPVSRTATLEPGLRGPRAEALLAEHGLTLGHFPQSFEYASIGGFAATRSSGQASAGYGRFDDLVRRADRGHPDRRADPRPRAAPTPPAPTCASWSSAPRAPSA